MLKMTFEMTREICKLVKESPQRNNRLEEIRKTTKYQVKSVHSFCPTKWTVRGETYSIISNYEQLMSLWEWSLQKLTNTKMKARIHGEISHIKKIDFFLGCRLGATIFNQTDNLSRALQKPALSVVEALDLALKVLAVLRKEQSNECFKEFWKLLSNKNSYALVESPVLPRRRKIPACYNDREDQHHHKDVEFMYRQLFYDAYDYVVSGIKNRFDQPDFKLYPHTQNLLLKAANVKKYLEEYNIICGGVQHYLRDL